ncbi:MAG: hypothetical protein AAGD25_33805, partial [Cyanobacteria bacterium P01_F01_bin.150]
MTILFEVELNPNQTERFPMPDEWSAVAIATTSEASLPVVGHAIALSGPNGTIETGNVLLDLRNSQLLQMANIGHPNAVELRVSDWIRKTAKVQIIGVVSADPDDLGDSESSNEGSSIAGLLELIPLPSSTGISIGPGRAIFEAGTVTKGWNVDKTTYTLSSAVSASEFWRIGFRSVQKFSRGRLRFGSGVGPSVLGLAPQFNNVDFSLTQWGFYVASASEVRVFEFRDGAIANVAQFPWTPSRDLGIRIEGDQVYYEML